MDINALLKLTHFSSLIAHRKLPSRAYDHLVIMYRPKPRGPGELSLTQIKYPGGKSEPGENPYDTASREMYTETGLVVRRESVRRLNRLPIKIDHVQYFYETSIENCSGRLRGEGRELRDINELRDFETSLKWFEEEGSFITEPFWTSTNILYPLLHPTHKGGLLSFATRKVAKKQPQSRRYALAR